MWEYLRISERNPNELHKWRDVHVKEGRRILRKLLQDKHSRMATWLVCSVNQTENLIYLSSTRPKSIKRISFSFLQPLEGTLYLKFHTLGSKSTTWPSKTTYGVTVIVIPHTPPYLAFPVNSYLELYSPCALLWCRSWWAQCASN